MLYSIRAYMMVGQQPGGFLTNAPENDFAAAVTSADGTTQTILREVGLYLYNYTTTHSWGSEKTVRKWIQKGGLYGMLATTENAVNNFEMNGM